MRDRACETSIPDFRATGFIFSVGDTWINIRAIMKIKQKGKKYKGKKN